MDFRWFCCYFVHADCVGSCHRAGMTEYLKTKKEMEVRFHADSVCCDWDSSGELR